ncbi:MAG: hypothetical protein ACREHG_07725, partial [Candidatus Saccharimonadales bacterium]
MSYVIQADKGNGIYVINTQDFGRVAIWTEDTAATITDAMPGPAAVTKTVTVQAGWGLEAVAEAAGIPNPASPTTWQAIARANG